jgi:hypothetical protein
MPRGRQPEGHAALTNAERQVRFRARRLALQPPVAVKRPAAGARRSRTKRWNDALAAALQEMIDLDLDAIAEIQPPLGYGRD